MNLGNFIKNYREENSMTMDVFAKRSGLTKGYISMLENNKNPKTGRPIVPSLEMIKKVASTIGISLDDLIRQLDGDQPISLKKEKVKGGQRAMKCYTVPILGDVAAGVPIEEIIDIKGYIEIPEWMLKRGNYFALKIKGKSMEPSMMDGDIIVIRQQKSAENDEIAVVTVDGNEATVKQIKLLENGLLLIPHNREYETKFYTAEEVENKPVEIIGKVVELRREYEEH